MKKLSALLLLVVILAIASVGCTRLLKMKESDYVVTGTFTAEDPVDFSLIQVGLRTAANAYTAGTDHGFVTPDDEGNWTATVWRTVTVTPQGTRPGFVFDPEEATVTPGNPVANFTVRDTYYTASGTFSTDVEMDLSELTITFASADLTDFGVATVNSDGTWEWGLWTDNEITVTPVITQIGDYQTMFEPESIVVSKDNPTADFNVYLVAAEAFNAIIQVNVDDEPIPNVPVSLGQGLGTQVTDHNGQVVIENVVGMLPATIQKEGWVPTSGVATAANPHIILEGTVNEVVIPDANLEAVLREWFAKPEGAILPSDFRDWMDNVMVDGIVDLSHRQITNIEGVQWFTRMVQLKLHGNNTVADLAPLSYHKTLNSLWNHRGWNSDPGGTTITTLAPLNTIPNLQYLVLNWVNSLQDMSSLNGNESLVQLDYRGHGNYTGFNSMAFAPYLPNLETFVRRDGGNQWQTLFDTTGIAEKFPSLVTFDLGNTVVQSVLPLMDLPNLAVMDIANCDAEGVVEILAAKPDLQSSCRL